MTNRNKRRHTLSLPFDQSGPNSGSARASMADMWMATGGIVRANWLASLSGQRRFGA